MLVIPAIIFPPELIKVWRETIHKTLKNQPSGDGEGGTRSRCEISNTENKWTEELRRARERKKEAAGTAETDGFYRNDVKMTQNQKSLHLHAGFWVFNKLPGQTFVWFKKNKSTISFYWVLQSKWKKLQKLIQLINNNRKV